MSPEEFIAKWRGTTRTELSAAQEHFLDLCVLLGVPKPADVDRHGTEYTFEKSTRKIGGTAGFADVCQDSLYLHALSVEMAEAFAEYLHKRIRGELGFAAEEPRDPEAMLLVWI
jgi:Vitamin B12 dependent methionine synthase, activation domain